MQSLKQFILVAAVLATMMGRTKAFDFGTLRGHLEEEPKNDFAQRMSVAASKESARHLLRKWLLRPEEKKPEVAVKPETHEETSEVIVARPEERNTLVTEYTRKDWPFYRSPSIIPLARDHVRPGRKLAELVTGVSQTYFVPLEESMLIETFVTLSKGVTPSELEANSNTPVNTFISVTIAYDGTIIVWDHWEDGYEDMEGAADQTTTEVWGDGNCDNGSRPDVDCVNPEDDILEAGDAVVINNLVLLPRDLSDFYYDGRDLIVVSDPVQVVRGGFANSTGPLLAGAVEVYRTEEWGKEFVSPVGEDTVNQDTLRLDPFRTTSLYLMARFNDTEITYDSSTGGGQVTIGQGECFVIDGVNQGNKISSTKDIQVHILTGEVGFPYYELRWYSLLDMDKWSNEYYSPVGISDGKKETRIWIFNPNDAPLKVTIETLEGDDIVNSTINVPAGDAVRTGFAIPSGSGARVYSGEEERDKAEIVANGGNFFAFTQTDIEDSTNQALSGQREDWGHTLIAVRDLTAQATVGVGWGCPQQRTAGSLPCSTFTKQTGGSDPEVVTEVVWITVREDATCFVDYSGEGTTISQSYNIPELASINITNEETNDLSGALIWCVEEGKGPTDKGVLAALAYGQDPTRTEGESGADLGYVIQGEVLLKGTKEWKLENNLNPGDDGEVNVGDNLLYTLEILNQALSPYSASRLSICDKLPDEVELDTEVCWKIVAGEGDDSELVEEGCLGPVEEEKFFNGTCWSPPRGDIPTRPGKLIIFFNVIVTAVPDDVGDDGCGDIVNEFTFSYRDVDRSKEESGPITATTPTCPLCINDKMGNATDTGCEDFDDKPLCKAGPGMPGDVCKKCQVDPDKDIDINCNEDNPICVDTDDGYGDICVPAPTTTTIATTTIPATTTTPISIPPKPPCDPTLCQACWYFCGHPDPDDGYTCNPKGPDGGIMSGAYSTNAPVYSSCRVHPFCNMCGLMCPDIGEDEHCPAGACPTDENEVCD